MKTTGAKTIDQPETTGEWKRSMNECRAVRAVLMAALMMLSAAGGYAGEKAVVKPGDQADVHFTCRLRNGDIAASSYQSIGDDVSLRKSVLFVRRAVNTPLSVRASQSADLPISRQSGTKQATRGFEAEIVHQVSAAIVGLPVGEKQVREVRAEPLPETKAGEYLSKIARVRERAKEMRLTRGDYESRMGKIAEAGQRFVLDPAIPGTVASVTQTEVVVQFRPVVSARVETPFGEGKVRELEDKYEIVIDARKGGLVRTGGYVGRIVDVDDRFITVDYGHPFGGETLLCEILVESTRTGD